MLQKIRNMKRAKEALSYAKKMCFNKDVIMADIDLDLTDMENRVSRADKIRPLPKDLVTEYRNDIRRLRELIKSGNLAKSVKFIKTLGKKHMEIENTIKQTIGD